MPDPDADPAALAAAQRRPRWFERAAEAPRPPSPIAALEHAQDRDEWMKAPPTAGAAAAVGDMAGLASRGFMRKTDDVAKPTAKDTADWTETPADRERALVVASKNRGVPMSLAEVAAQAQARGRAAISSGTSAPVAERKGPAPKTLVEVRTPTPDPPPSPLARCAPRRSPSPQTPLLQLSCPPSRQVHQELAEKKKKETKGKAEWEGKHPWKVRSRSTNPNQSPNPDRNWNRNP